LGLAKVIIVKKFGKSTSLCTMQWRGSTQRLHSMYFCKRCLGTDAEVQTDTLCFHIFNATSEVTGLSIKIIYNNKAIFYAHLFKACLLQAPLPNYTTS